MVAPVHALQVCRPCQARAATCVLPQCRRRAAGAPFESLFREMGRPARGLSLVPRPRLARARAQPRRHRRNTRHPDPRTRWSSRDVRKAGRAAPPAPDRGPESDRLLRSPRLGARRRLGVPGLSRQDDPVLAVAPRKRLRAARVHHRNERRPVCHPGLENAAPGEGRLADSISQIFQTPSATVGAVLREMAGFDFIVTAKFHGIIFSHLLGKPIVSLSYHRKMDAAMDSVGQGRFNANIERFDVEWLIGAFRSLGDERDRIRSRCKTAVEARAADLSRQFDGLFTKSSTSHRLGPARRIPSFDSKPEQSPHDGGGSEMTPRHLRTALAVRSGDSLSSPGCFQTRCSPRHLPSWREGISSPEPSRSRWPRATSTATGCAISRWPTMAPAPPSSRCCWAMGTGPSSRLAMSTQAPAPRRWRSPISTVTGTRIWWRPTSAPSPSR